MLRKILGSRSGKPRLPALSPSEALATLSSALKDSQLSPILDVANRLWSDDSTYVRATGGLHISHRPKVAPQAFAVVLYLPLEAESISRYEQTHSISIPATFRDILRLLNGAFLFELSLFGVPPSMVDGGLDRSVLQPHDLSTANCYWRASYHAPADSFYIGGGPFSSEEHVAYFLLEDGSIESYRKGGEIVRGWPDYRVFLSEEIARSEAMYPEYEAFMERLNKK